MTQIYKLLVFTLKLKRIVNSSESMIVNLMFDSNFEQNPSNNAEVEHLARLQMLQEQESEGIRPTKKKQICLEEDEKQERKRGNGEQEV